MRPDVSRFKYLWDGSEPGWILFGHPQHGPINILSNPNMGIIIEDNDEFAAVIEQMTLHGLPVARTLAELEALRAIYAATGSFPRSAL